MINETLFLGQILLIVFLDLLAAYLGREYLLSLIVVQGLLANFFILKQVSMFGLVVTCTDVFIIGMVLALNLLEEIYGKEASSKAINSYFFTLIVVFLFKFFHLSYVPASVDQTQGHYLALLSETGRIIFATLAVSFLSLHMDRYLYRLLSSKLDVRFLSLKNFITTAVSQLFDTILFSYLALFGIFASMWDLIVFSYTIKLVSLGLTTFILFILKKQIALLKRLAFNG